VFIFGALRNGIRRTGASQASGDANIGWKACGHPDRVEYFSLHLEKTFPVPKICCVFFN